jgi:hypothetical protein
MFKNKENIFAFIISIVDLTLWIYKLKAPLSETFTYFPLIAFLLIFYANYLSQFSPNVLGMRGRGVGSWYKNTYIILTQKFLGWLILILSLLLPFFIK